MESKVTSLTNKRQQRKREERKLGLDRETRIRELEEDVLRLIDFTAHIDKEVSELRKSLNKLLKLLLDASSSEKG